MNITHTHRVHKQTHPSGTLTAVRFEATTDTPLTPAVVALLVEAALEALPMHTGLRVERYWAIGTADLTVLVAHEPKRRLPVPPMSPYTEPRRLHLVDTRL